MPHFSLPLTHLVLADPILVKIEAVDLVLVEELLALNMLDNLHLDHLLADAPRLAIVVLRLVDDPVEDLLAPQAPLVHREPTRLEVLHFQLAAHDLGPVL